MSWKRPKTIPLIVESLIRWPFIREIIIADNSQDVHPEWHEMICRIGKDRLKIFRFDRNRCTYARFLAASHASSEAIYTQDDDSCVNNVETLYEAFLKRPDCITAGLANDQYSRHYDMEANKRPWILLGFGSIWPKSALSIFDQWTLKFGECNLLERKADRIFSVLYGRHNPILADITRLRDDNGRHLDRDQNALWLRSDHGRLTNESVAKALDIKKMLAKSR